MKEEKIKSASAPALVSADPPERACGITILPIKQQDPGQPPERDLPLTEGAVNWRRERPEGKEKFLVYGG